jgi:hypothetical protein
MKVLIVSDKAGSIVGAAVITENKNAPKPGIAPHPDYSAHEFDLPSTLEGKGLAAVHASWKVEQSGAVPVLKKR